jgi:hypothetical protein
MGRRFISHKNEPESHFRGGKSQAQILRGGEQFPRCRKYGINVLAIFVKNQSFLKK